MYFDTLAATSCGMRPGARFERKGAVQRLSHAIQASSPLQFNSLPVHSILHLHVLTIMVFVFDILCISLAEVRVLVDLLSLCYRERCMTCLGLVFPTALETHLHPPYLSAAVYQSTADHCGQEL